MKAESAVFATLYARLVYLAGLGPTLLAIALELYLVKFKKGFWRGNVPIVSPISLTY